MTSDNIERMHRSLPNLNYDMNDDNSFDFTEPDFKEFAGNTFRKTLAKGESPFLFEQDETARKQRSTAVKVKASQLQNMSVNEKEIKSLFKEWKCEQKKKSKPVKKESDSPLSSSNMMIIAPANANSASPKKKNKKTIQIPSISVKDSSPSCPIQHFNESFSNLRFNTGDLFSSAEAGQIAPSSKKAMTNSPTKKKKVAVKLKASDLNISPGKKEEIEQLFWKWKGDVKDPNTVVPKIKPSVDPRWEVKKREAERPIPAYRQRSSSLEPQDVDFGPTEKRLGSTRPRSESLGRDSVGIRPPSRRTSSGRLNEHSLGPSCQLGNSDERTLSSTESSSSGSSALSSPRNVRSRSVSRQFRTAYHRGDTNETMFDNSSDSKETRSSADSSGNARCKSRGRSRSCHRRRESPREQSSIEKGSSKSQPMEGKRDAEAPAQCKRSSSQRRRSFSRTSSRDGEKFEIQ
jgi:hypothetical protein